MPGRRPQPRVEQTNIAPIATRFSLLPPGAVRWTVPLADALPTFLRATVLP